jgi:hypothetical protein
LSVEQSRCSAARQHTTHKCTIDKGKLQGLPVATQPHTCIVVATHSSACLRLAFMCQTICSEACGSLRPQHRHPVCTSHNLTQATCLAATPGRKVDCPHEQAPAGRLLMFSALSALVNPWKVRHDAKLQTHCVPKQYPPNPAWNPAPGQLAVNTRTDTVTNHRLVAGATPHKITDAFCELLHAEHELRCQQLHKGQHSKGADRW